MRTVALFSASASCWTLIAAWTILPCHFAVPQTAESAAGENASRLATGATTTNAQSISTPSLLTLFARSQKKRADELANSLGIPLPDEYTALFEAAGNGEWKTFAPRFQAIAKGRGLHAPLWDPLNETAAAISVLQEGSAEVVRSFADDILNAIPDGSVLLAGTPLGRFPPMVLQHVSGKPNVCIVSQTTLSNESYMNYIRFLYGGRIWLPGTNWPTEVLAVYRSEISAGRMKPAAGVEIDGERISLHGAAAAEAINGLLARMIFQNNCSNRSVYVEFGSPMPWAYPYAEPRGPVVRLGRDPLDRLPPSVVADDMAAWKRYIQRLARDERYLKDNWVRGAVSTLRARMSEIYVWRRMTPDAARALVQAIQLYPDNYEPTARLADLYVKSDQPDKAIGVLRTFHGTPAENAAASRLMETIYARLSSPKAPRADPTNPPPPASGDQQPSPRPEPGH